MVLFLLTNFAYAQSPLTNSVVWISDEDVAEKICPKLDNYPILEKAKQVCDETLVKCEQNNDDFQKIIANKDKEIAEGKKTIVDITEMRKTEKAYYEQRIKEVTPSLFDKAKIFGTGVLSGGVFLVILKIAGFIAL